jgi:hypothetical protein
MSAPIAKCMRRGTSLLSFDTEGVGEPSPGLRSGRWRHIQPELRDASLKARLPSGEEWLVLQILETPWHIPPTTPPHKNNRMQVGTLHSDALQRSGSAGFARRQLISPSGFFPV